MKTLIKNGTVMNPHTNDCRTADVLVVAGMVQSIGELSSLKADQVIHANGLLVVPGLVDIHVHFRDPGFPHKETIRTGAMSAVAGGFTTVVCMPNTKPAIDTVETLQYVLDAGRNEGLLNVYSSAAITAGLGNEKLTDLDSLGKAGAVTFTDDGRTVMNPKLLLEAFTKAAKLGIPISSHCEDHHLITEGSINKGKISDQLQDPGIMALAEETIIARDILYAEQTGAKLHIQHVSTARGIQLIREAKARGVAVTAEGAPHHFSLTDHQVLVSGTLAKVNPPLRTQADVDAVIQGLADGTLDAIATDHAPHTLEEKARPLSESPFGMVGLETAVGLTWTHLVHTGKLSETDAVAKLTVIPASIMKLPVGRLEEGLPADITIIDPHKEWLVDPELFYSKSRNTPFTGMKLKGKAVLTMYRGKVVYRELN